MPHPLKGFFLNTEHDIQNKKYHPNYEVQLKFHQDKYYY